MQRKKNRCFSLTFMDKTCIHACLSKWMILPSSQKEKNVPQDFWLRPHKYHFNSSYLNLLVCVIYQAFFHTQHFYQNQVLLNFSFCFKFLKNVPRQKCPQKIAAIKWLIAPTLQHGRFVLNVSRPWDVEIQQPDGSDPDELVRVYLPTFYP